VATAGASATYSEPVLRRPKRLTAIATTVVAAASLTVSGLAGGGGAHAAHLAKARATASSSCQKSVVAAGDMLGVTQPRETGRLAVRLKPNLVLTLGDEQYANGSLKLFDSDYAKTGWGQLKARTRPVPGNHEYETPGALGYFLYFNHPPRYYAFNIGCGWRGYALDSEINLTKESAWLQRDLAAHPHSMVIAYWHRPFLSSGQKHGGDIHMVALWRPLQGRPAIVLTGHEHNYERFKPRHDIREFVVGTGGSSTYLFRRHPAHGSKRRIAHTPGLLRLHLFTGSYTWSFRTTSNRLIDTGHSS
jgi:calcineurin-like phosphoesterase family protein